MMFLSKIMSDFDEDVELPNSPLDQYLKQFHSNFPDEATIGEQATQATESKSENEQQSTQSQFNRKTNPERQYSISHAFNNFKLFILYLKRKLIYDQVFINNLLKTDTSVLYLKILTHDDEAIIFDTVALIASKELSKPSSSSTQRYYSSLACLLVLSLAFILFLLQLFGFLFILIALALLLLGFDTFLYKKLFYLTLDQASQTMTSIQSILYYLKQIELLGFNMTNRFQLHNNNSLNIEFRKLAFKYFRQYFYEQRRVNLKLYEDLCKNTSVNDNDLKLICTLDQTELGQLLIDEEESDEQLAKLSENFHLNSIKCLAKLVYMQISEQFKLILLIYLHSNTNVNNLFEILFKNMIFSYKYLRKKNVEIKELIEICKLKCGKKDENDKKKREKLDKTSSLSLHLRNALLNSYKLEETECNQNLIESIEYDLEFCRIYMKQLRSDYEGDAASGKGDESGKLVAHLDVNNKDGGEKCVERASASDKVVDENDYIFEALSNEVDLASSAGGGGADPDNFEFELEKREFDLLNHNLYTELKGALVVKKSEWEERERNATRHIDPSMANIKDDKSETDDFKPSALLDNQILKYKTSLRKRGTLTKSKKANKYAYDNENDSTASAAAASTFSILQEHKSNLFNELLKRKTEDDTDEIIYE